MSASQNIFTVSTQYSVSDEESSNSELQDNSDNSDESVLDDMINNEVSANHGQEENEVSANHDQEENKISANQGQEEYEVSANHGQVENEEETSKNNGDMQIDQMSGQNLTWQPSAKGLYLRRPCITRKAAVVKASATYFRFASVSNQTNRFYGQGCPGIKVRAVPVMIFTVSFMFLIIFLHLWTKFYAKKIK